MVHNKMVIIYNIFPKYQSLQSRDYLQYVIDETRKSKTYKMGRVITAIPRKKREKYNLIEMRLL